MDNQASTLNGRHWLQSYYFARAGFSIAWIAAAILFVDHPLAVALLLIVYPAWDALANFADAARSGGLRANPSQSLNVLVSSIMTIAVLITLGSSPYAVLAAFGAWAIFSGLLQLYTAARRWRAYGAQWAMILSGAQSALAGGFMLSRSVGSAIPTILDIAPYVGFGAFYFAVSALWLVVQGRRTAVA